MDEPLLPSSLVRDQPPPSLYRVGYRKSTLEVQEGDDEEETVWGSADEENVEETTIALSDLKATCPNRIIRWLHRFGEEPLETFHERDTRLVAAFRQRGASDVTHGGLLTLGLSEKSPRELRRLWKLLMLREGGAAASSAERSEGWSARMLCQASVVTLKDAAKEGEFGLLQPLLQRWKQGTVHVSVFGLPAVASVIEYKWHAFARRFVLYESLLFLLLFGGFVSFTLLINHLDPSLWALRALLYHGGWRGAVAIVSLSISIICLIPFLFIEYRAIKAYRWGYIGVWNMIDVLSYIGLLGVALLHGTGWATPDTLSVLTAFESLLLFIKLQWFLRVFQPLRSTPVDILRRVIYEMRHFLLLSLVTLIGFAHAFEILFRLQPIESYPSAASEDYSTIGRSFVSVLGVALAMFTAQTYFTARSPIAATFMFVLFLFVVSILLLNLLIAVSSASFVVVRSKEHVHHLCSKAQIITEVEHLLPSSLKRRNAREWFPDYVHVLRIIDTGEIRPMRHEATNKNNNVDTNGADTVVEPGVDEQGVEETAIDLMRSTPRSTPRLVAQSPDLDPGMMYRVRGNDAALSPSWISSEATVAAQEASADVMPLEEVRFTRWMDAVERRIDARLDRMERMMRVALKQRRKSSDNLAAS